MQVAGRLQDFRELVKEVVRSACRTALLEAGFTPDDYFYDGLDDGPGVCFLLQNKFLNVLIHVICLCSYACVSQDVHSTLNYVCVLS